MLPGAGAQRAEVPRGHTAFCAPRLQALGHIEWRVYIRTGTGGSMTRLNVVIGLCAVVAAAPVAKAAHAQVRQLPGPRPSVAQIVTQIEAGHVPVSAAADALSGKVPRVSAADHQRIQDALVETAIRDPGQSAKALAALGMAGSPHAPARLATAFDAIKEVYDRTGDPAVKTGALHAMTNLADKTRPIAIWRAIAVSNPPAFPLGPLQSIEYLALYGGDDGRAILKQLFEQNAVPDKTAADELQRLAARGFRYPAGQ